MKYTKAKFFLTNMSLEMRIKSWQREKSAGRSWGKEVVSFADHKVLHEGLSGIVMQLTPDSPTLLLLHQRIWR